MITLFTQSNIVSIKRKVQKNFDGFILRILKKTMSLGVLLLLLVQNIAPALVTIGTIATINNTFAAASDHFVSTWKTDNAGTSGSTSITIPTAGAGYNYDVDWNNDGTFDEFGLTGSVTHNFGVAGTYTIRIQ